MALALLIEGATKRPLPGWTITEAIGNRSVFSFSILVDYVADVPVTGDEVLFTEGGVRIFGGTVDTPAVSGVNNELTGTMLVQISCTDFNALADTRYVQLDLDAMTLKAVLQAAYTAGYFPTGVLLDPAQVAGPTLPNLSFRDYEDRCMFSNFLNEICALDPTDKYIWNIDYYKYLKAFLPTSNPAPVNIVDGDGNLIGDLRVEPSSLNYANRIILLFDAIDAPVSAWGFLQTTANFVDGDKVKVGGNTYTFKNSVGTTANQVKVGATAKDSLTNLVAAMNLGAGSGTLYGSETTLNESAYSYLGNIGETDANMAAKAHEPGAGGNSIAVESVHSDDSPNTGAVWIWEGGILLTTLQGGEDERTLIKYVEASSPAYLLNPRERTIKVPGLTDPVVAQRLCDNALQLALNIPNKVSYTTFATGLHPGQYQLIQNAKRGVNAYFLITDVTIRSRDAGDGTGIIIREVTAIEGMVYNDDWRQSSMFGGGGEISSGPLTIVNNTTGSGGTGGVASTIIELGGSRLYGYTSAVWRDAPEFNDKILNVTEVGRFRCHQKTDNAGTSVQARVVAVDSAGAVIAECAISPASTNTGWGYGEAGHYVDVEFTPLIGANAYRLQIKGSNASATVWVAGAHLAW